MESNNNNNNNNNNDEIVRPPDAIFCEKLIEDEENDYNFQINQHINSIPKFKRHITNTWTNQKTLDNKFISVPIFKEYDESDDDKDILDEENFTWLNDSLLFDLIFD
jgi:hypothetical protein